MGKGFFSREYSFYPKELSVWQAMRCFNTAKRLAKVFKKMGAEDETARAVAENVSVCFYSACDDDKRYFRSPLAVMKTLNLNELARYAEVYQNFGEGLEGYGIICPAAFNHDTDPDDDKIVGESTDLPGRMITYGEMKKLLNMKSKEERIACLKTK